MLLISRGRELTVQKARIQFHKSLYGKKPRRVTVDLFGQRMGKAGAITFHAGSKEVVAVLRRLADHIEKRENEHRLLECDNLDSLLPPCHGNAAAPVVY